MSVILGSNDATAFTANSISNGTAGTRWVGTIIEAVANGTINSLFVLDGSSDNAFKITLHSIDGTLLRVTGPIAAGAGNRSGAITPLDVTIGQQFYIGRYIQTGYGRYKGHTTLKARAQVIGTYASPAETISPAVDGGSALPLMWAEGTISSFAINHINNGDGVRVGSGNNQIVTAGLGNLNSLSIGGLLVGSLAAPGGSGTFSLPEPVDGSVYPPYGNNNAVAADGTNSSTAYVTSVLPKTTQDFRSLTSLNTSGPGKIAWHVQQAGLSPAVGDTITFDNAASLGVPINQVEEDGAILSDYIGTQTMLYRFAATGIVRYLSVMTGEGGEVISVRFIKGSLIKGNFLKGNFLKGEYL